MKRLIIIRHAKSSWDDPDMDDFERPLNKRGERDAPRMGKRLKEKDFALDLFISSPATRALSTSEKIAEVLKFPLEKIQTDRTLYHATDETILEVVRSISDKYNQVVLFGHNPGLTEFVNQLMNQHISNVPTCGVVSCGLPVKSWKEVTWGKGKLEFFDFPKNKES
jgi:phosphohistidine phosphatase